jgi:glycosyltransferase involved in cell wall biosynthesis
VPEAVAAAVRSRLGLPREYLLSVGTLERRKNHRVLVEALALLDPSHTPLLVLVGRDGGEASALRKLARTRGVSARVVMHHDVRAGELPALYQGAALFLYPSMFEGFGMPIVEALSTGVPVITTAGGCFPEAGGPSTRYVTSTDAVALAGAIHDILGDQDLAVRMRDAGRRWARRFDATALAAPLLALYHSVIH